MVLFVINAIIVDIIGSWNVLSPGCLTMIFTILNVAANSKGAGSGPAGPAMAGPFLGLIT